MRGLRSTSIAGLCTSLTLACADAPRGAMQGAGVAVPSLELSEPPVLVIGGNDDREEYQLYRVTNAYRLADGEIVIANSGTKELRYYDALGKHIRSIGRDGEGPGEFRSIRSVSRLPGDTLVVWDGMLSRLTFVAPGGRVQETVGIGAAPVFVTIGGESVPAFPSVLHLLADRTVVAEPIFLTEVTTRGPDGARRDTVPLLLFDRSGRRSGLLGPIAAGETLVHEGSSMRLPFGHRLHVAAGPDVLYIGTGKAPLVEIWTPEGARIDSIALSAEPAPVTDADIDAMKQRILALMTPRARASTEAMLAVMPAPETMPVFSDLHVAADGRLWVREYQSVPSGPQAWQIYTRGGERAARVTFPPGLQLLDAGRDYVIVLLRDELDVESVKLYELTGAG